MNQDLKKTLWAAADKLRSSMDAAEYKHIVLGLIFIKYISDAFDERRTELQAAFADPSNDLHLPDPQDHPAAADERARACLESVAPRTNAHPDGQAFADGNPGASRG